MICYVPCMGTPLRYQGELWEDERPAPELADLLGRRDAILEIGAPSERAPCVLGVPHHAGPGIDRIAERCPTGGRVADENAVLYALAAHTDLAARGVPSRVVIAAHATDHDPNKDAASPYCRGLFGGPPPRLLVECHGSGWATPHPLELSAGVNPVSDPLAFGRRIAAGLGEAEWVAAQKTPGDGAALVLDGRGDTARASRLKFPALRTTSLRLAAERGVAALHLEATPRFRTFGVSGLVLTSDGAALGRALAAAICATLDRT